MAKSSKLKIMISSRCDDPFPAAGTTTMTDIRRELKARVEQTTFAGKQIFEVWINEDAPPAAGDLNAWDGCLRQVNDCDILLVLSNGNAGWAKQNGDIGICHAELMEALSNAPAKVRLIQLPTLADQKDEEGARNKRFQDYLTRQSLSRGAIVDSKNALFEQVDETIYAVLVSLAQAGIRDAARSKFNSGPALDWSRLDFGARSSEMRKVVLEALRDRKGSQEINGKLFVVYDGTECLTEIHAIPSTLTVGPAKELVGQPFLRDHLLAGHLSKGQGGPIHFIACHKNATESQAAKLLGFPDATVVTGSFGVFVADPVQKVQFVFITNCRDESNTRHGVQRFIEWLEQTGEVERLARRAEARLRIVEAIALET